MAKYKKNLQPLGILACNSANKRTLRKEFSIESAITIQYVQRLQNFAILAPFL